MLWILGIGFACALVAAILTVSAVALSSQLSQVEEVMWDFDDEYFL